VLEAERLERVDVVAPSMAGTIVLELALGGDPRISQEEFSPAFRRSPMQRAKLRGLKRNAAVVLGNVGTMDDVEVLTWALDDPEPLVREHAAWALVRLGRQSS
jgi:epoxyqueuosine reductase QueG